VIDENTINPKNGIYKLMSVYRVISSRFQRVS